MIFLSIIWLMSLRSLSAASLFTGRKDVMSLRDSLSTPIGRSIMGTGFGFHAHRSFTRYALTFCYTIINITSEKSTI